VVRKRGGTADVYGGAKRKRRVVRKKPTAAAAPKRKRRVVRKRGGKKSMGGPTLIALQKEAKRLRIPLSAGGKRKNKSALVRAIGYRTTKTRR
jgi:hypothetical protein